jgi:hypothetical protein
VNFHSVIYNYVCRLGYTSSGASQFTGAAVNHICLPTDPT